MKKITIALCLFIFFLSGSKLNAACGYWKNKVTSFSTSDTCKRGFGSISLNNNCYYLKWSINGSTYVQGNYSSGYSSISFGITANGTYNVCVKVTDSCNNCDTTLCATITISCFKSCNWKSRLNLVYLTDTCLNNYNIHSIAGTVYYATGVNSSCYKYQWKINNVLKSTNKNFNYKVTQNGTYTQCLKITDTCNNCDTTICRTVTFSCFPNCNWKGQNPQFYAKDSCTGTSYSIHAIVLFNGTIPGHFRYNRTLNGSPVSNYTDIPVTSNGTYTVCIKITDTIKKCDTTFCKHIVVDCITACNWKNRTPSFFAYDSCTSTVYKIMTGISFNGTYSGKYKAKWTLNGNAVGYNGPVQQLIVTQNGTYTLCVKVTDTLYKCDTTFCKQVVVDCIKTCNWKSRSPYTYFNDTCKGPGLRNKIHGYISFASGGCYKYRWSVNGIPVNTTTGYPFWLIYDVTKNGTYTVCVKVTDTCNNCDTTFCSTKTFSCLSACNWKGRISNAYMSDTCRGYNSKNNIHGYVSFKTGVNSSCYKYEWKINNAVVSIKDRMDYMVTQDGSYYQCVKITDTCNNCDTTICRYVTFNCIGNSCLWKHTLSMTLKNKCYNNKDTVYVSVGNQNTSSCVKYTWTLNGKTVPRYYGTAAIIITQNGTYQLCAKVRDTCNNCDTFICKTFTVNCFSNTNCKNWKGRSPWFQVWDSCQSYSFKKSINGYINLDTPGCYKYRWTINGNAVSSSKALKYNLTANGTYNVCVKVTDTCNNCDTTFCSTRTITCFNGCNFKSGKPVFATYDTCLGNRNKVSGYISFTNKPCLKYLWTVGGVGVSTSSSFVSNIYTNGTYKICVKVSDTCNKCDTTICTTRIINCSGLGIKKTGLTENIKVYPNPTDGVLNIDWGGSSGHFDIVDMTGSLIYKGELTEGKNTLQTDAWANGVYMLRVNDSYGTRILKIVLSR